ncbi:MAG: hypothetical protein M3037_14505 [Gemmatimonadota bacterium]|nr:hypothetical protein [Gemmatimonadota bacterium]
MPSTRSALDSDPNVLPLTWVGYIVAAWTSVFGRRSLGTRFICLRGRSVA